MRQRSGTSKRNELLLLLLLLDAGEGDRRAQYTQESSEQLISCRCQGPLFLFFFFLFLFTLDLQSCWLR